MLTLSRAVLLFGLTAVAEILGCYLPTSDCAKAARPAFSSRLRRASARSWLLTLHPTGAGRTYAAYGGIYIVASIAWLRFVEGQSVDRWDLIGGALCLVGMGVIVLGPR